MSAIPDRWLFASGSTLSVIPVVTIPAGAANVRRILDSLSLYVVDASGGPPGGSGSIFAARTNGILLFSRRIITSSSPGPPIILDTAGFDNLPAPLVGAPGFSIVLQFDTAPPAPFYQQIVAGGYNR